MRQDHKHLSKIDRIVRSQAVLMKEFEQEMKEHEKWLKKHDRWFRHFEQRFRLHYQLISQLQS